MHVADWLKTIIITDVTDGSALELLIYS